jgi:hypothetical protein
MASSCGVEEKRRFTRGTPRLWKNWNRKIKFFKMISA